MRSFVKTFLFLISFFINDSTFASHIDNSEREKLIQIFFQLLDDYPIALDHAVKAGDVSKMQGVVEFESPWYNFLEFAEKSNDFVLPRFCGGIRICSLPYLPFLMAKSELIKNISTVQIIRNPVQKKLYSFIIIGVEITVSYKDSVMRLYQLISPKINTFYAKPILEQFFL